MKEDLDRFVTVSGVIWAVIFISVGAFFLYTEQRRISVLEIVLNIGIFFVLMPVVSLWANSKGS